MKTYKSIPLERAYNILNTGALILISSASSDSRHNLAPISWNCPVVFDPVAKFLFVCDKGNQTYMNICETGKFVVCIPHATQYKLALDLGSCSGRTVHKIEKFAMNTFKSEKFQLSVPEDCIAYVECKLKRIIDEDNVGIVESEVVHAEVDTNAFTHRLLTETEQGKTLYYLRAQNDRVIPSFKMSR